MNKKIISLLLISALLLLSLSGCSQNTAGGSNSEKRELNTTVNSSEGNTNFRLSYTMSDSLNPYKSESVNNRILETLVYDSLFIIDESYEAVPSIAESCDYTTAEKLNVKIKNNLKFSDGTPLTADNVKYSFNRAKDSSQWSEYLSNFESAQVIDPYSITFNLKSANPQAHKLLTFAITKEKNDKSGFKIGSGRYKFINSENGGVALEKNNYHPDFKPHFTKINLVNVTSEDSIRNAVNIGNISYAFLDMSSSEKTKILSSTKAIGLNNLVFLGINCKSGITENKYIRRAVNLAIDRDTLVKSAYRGYAESALSIYNPDAAISKQAQIFESSADSAAAKQAVDASGYSSDKLNLTLLCDKSESKKAAAELIKQQLESAGFKVKINSLKKSSYKEYVEKGYYDLYLGETKLTPDMNFSEFFTKNGSLNYGIDTGSDTANAYKDYLKGKGEVGDFLISFTQEIPFVPLLYRKGVICYSKSLQGDMQGYEGNWFSNIEDWYYN